MVHWFPVFYDEFHQQPLFSPLCSQSLSLSLSVSDIIKPLILRSTFPKLASPCRYSILPAITHPIDWLLDPSLVIGIHVWILFETLYTIILEDRILLTNLLLMIIYLRFLFRKRSRSRWDSSNHNFPFSPPTIFHCSPTFSPRRGTLLLLFELVTEDHFRCGVESIASFLCVGFDCRLESDSSLPDRGKLGVMHTSHVMVGDPRDLFFFREEEEEEEA